jgi:hypothetical protein
MRKADISEWPVRVCITKAVDDAVITSPEGQRMVGLSPEQVRALLVGQRGLAYKMRCNGIRIVLDNDHTVWGWDANWRLIQGAKR